MRNLMLTLLLMISSDTFAQIGKTKIHDKIIEVGRVERQHGEYYTLYKLGFLEVDQGLRSYALVFTNEMTLYENKGADIRALSFLATQAEFDYFYNFLMQGFKEDNFRTLEVGQDVVKTLPLTSRFLYIFVNFEDGTSASLKLDKRQLDKLFGKK